MKRKNLALKKGLFIAFCAFMLVGCKQQVDEAKLQQLTETAVMDWNSKLTDVIVADIFTPPVSSRIYAYCNVAAYEVMCKTDTSFQSFAGKLNDLDTTPDPEEGKEYNFPVAAMVAFSSVGKNLVFNTEAMEKLQSDYLDEIRSTNLNKATIENSIAFGNQMADHIMAWVKKDGYKERSAMSRYQINHNDPGTWQPTPPNYMEAIEPNWSTLRPFTLKASDQFVPAPPTQFDSIPSSQFYKETMYVYESVNNLNEENLAKAKFWDCNPNISYTQGHVMYYKQQISPGGHWIMIACQVAKAEKLNPMKASEVLAKTAVTIADAFISCWTAKYETQLIRPETYINRYIDPDWKPILQTPAFPEYTSGHSVASSSAATMLTHLLGDNYSFVDSTEVNYGLPPRSFKSFRHAADEAAISRLYGGIHYMPAIKNGVEQGKKVGEHAIAILN
ncbi:vanadium-dependent haloperoxidase [Allomuricauda sp. CP2A]|uniref:vanadium-dependent haloperoxidase n=1 Tax=Allomuricauda sp. CP2A TaxID=1848189 RepID=UPI000829923D|nr:vanadium-dependent haloperoxidase [Muricauda sp. CP2A]